MVLTQDGLPTDTGLDLASGPEPAPTTITIQAVDSSGAPFPGAVDLFVESKRGLAPDPWPERLTLRVTARPPTDPEGPRATSKVRLRSKGRGQWTAVVEPDVAYEIGVWGPARAWSSSVVTASRGSNLEHRLLIPDAQPSGVLSLTALDSRGSSLGGPLRIRAFDAEGGIPLAEWGPEDIEAWPAELVLPPGPLRIRIDGQPYLATGVGDGIDLRTLGGFESTVEVRGGVRTEFAASLGEGARIRVLAQGTPPPPKPRSEARSAGRTCRSKCAKVQLELHRPGAWPTPLEFVRIGRRGTDSAGNQVYGSVRFGEESTSEFTTAGTYLLVGRLRDGRVATRKVTLVDGQTTYVELDFP